MTFHKFSQILSYATSRFILGCSALMIVALYVITAFNEPHPIVKYAPTIQENAQEETPAVKSEMVCEKPSYPKPISKPTTNPITLISVKTSDELSKLFDRQNYTLEANDDGHLIVPQLYLAKLPKDFNKKIHRQDRQDLFVQSLLPLVLDANHEITRERAQLLEMKEALDNGQNLSLDQKRWLVNLAKKYKTSSTNVRMLLKRVDVIPPSLALAQAIEETGWGTSHAARNKNSTFGTTLSTGVKAYESLYASVRGYVLNLNSNPAYADMRQIRHELRQKGKSLCSETLSTGLHRYSELRTAYIKKIKRIIKCYDLKRFDSAKLQTL